MNEVIPFGNIESGVVDSGAPVKIGGVARQTNPPAVRDTTRVGASFDDVGRQLTRPYQVRDLINTAQASLANGTKTQLIAGVSEAYLDLIQISCYNNSDAATVVALTDESTTIRNIPVPANNVTHINFQLPLKQSAVNVAWYVDLPDITGTTVEINAEFIQEV